MEKSTIHAPIRVLALYDYKGWAWWHRLHNIKRHLPDDIELDIREVYDNFIIDDYDLFMVFEEYLIPLLQYLPPQCLISGSSCARIACAAARAQTEKRCTATIFNSLEMYKSAGALPGMYCCQNGVDSVFFTPAAERPAKLTACWVGNSKSICCKGLDIIQEACNKAEVPLLFRDHAQHTTPLTHAEIRDMYYHRSSVYLCASQWEETPNPALEALSCGLPVISTPVGNMPEIIQTGFNGFLVERSVDAFVAALEQLKNSDMQQFSENARNSILHGWTWEHQALKYAAMFREIAAKNSLSVKMALPHRSYRTYLLIQSLKNLIKGDFNEGISRFLWAIRYSTAFQLLRHIKHLKK